MGTIIYHIARICIDCQQKYGEHESTTPAIGVSHGFCSGCLNGRLEKKRQDKTRAKVVQIKNEEE